MVEVLRVYLYSSDVEADEPDNCIDFFIIARVGAATNKTETNK